jgi:HSP20 family protein
MYEDPQDMFRKMDRLFSHLFAQMTSDFSAGDPRVSSFHLVMPAGEMPSQIPGLHDTLHRRSTRPAVEVHRHGNEVKAVTELPGAAEDGIMLNVQGSALIIDADGGHVQYHTTAPLPPVDPVSMQASFKNGILEVTFKILPDMSDENIS